MPVCFLLCVCVCVYIYIYIHTYIYTYIYHKNTTIMYGMNKPVVKKMSDIKQTWQHIYTQKTTHERYSNQHKTVALRQEFGTPPEHAATSRNWVLQLHTCYMQQQSQLDLKSIHPKSTLNLTRRVLWCQFLHTQNIPV